MDFKNTLGFILRKAKPERVAQKPYFVLRKYFSSKIHVFVISGVAF